MVGSTPGRDALVLVPPGLAAVLVKEAQGHGLRAHGLGGDRRADVVSVSGPLDVISRLRTAEDVCLAVGRWPVDRRRVERVVREVTPGRAPRVRVVARVSDERMFTRTGLRSTVERALGRLVSPEPEADELWVLQTGPDRFHTGVRVKAWSRRSDRTVERHGALRPAVAAAMVLLADHPARILDPCCGSGTILAEAKAAGGDAIGGDVDPDAVVAAGTNSGAPVVQLDARRLSFGDDSFDAVITNLPFGQQHQVQGTPVAWYRRVLTEAVRVAPTTVVLMAPTQPFRQALGRLAVEVVDRRDLVVLGQPAAIWVVRRRG